MLLCRVIGQAVSTVKDEGLRAASLQLVRAVDPAGGDVAGAEAFVAVNAVGAGEGELVLVALGSAARAVERVEGPVDAAIVAIIDSLTVDGARSYDRNG